jgi:DcmR-like sensory protein
VSWSSFIESASPSEHGVQIYERPDELSESVAAFLDAGFAAQAPAIVVATPDHWKGIAQRLEAHAWDIGRLERQGLIAYREAASLLAAFMDGDLPSPHRFAEVVGGLVDGVAARFRGRTTRVFGEMVDLLARRGLEPAAAALEELWNELLRTRHVALLCAYQLDVFDVDAQGQALPEVFRTHTHARPTSDGRRFAAAVDRAVTEILGPNETTRVYLDVAEHVPRTALPRAQAVLGWLAAQDAPRAARVLERARSHYRFLAV